MCAAAKLCASAPSGLDACRGWSSEVRRVRSVKQNNIQCANRSRSVVIDARQACTKRLLFFSSKWSLYNIIAPWTVHLRTNYMFDTILCALRIYRKWTKVMAFLKMSASDKCDAKAIHQEIVYIVSQHRERARMLSLIPIGKYGCTCVVAKHSTGG